jgi:glutaryl-CoA dehydrogenase (non-decarboxylating)
VDCAGWLKNEGRRNTARPGWRSGSRPSRPSAPPAMRCRSRRQRLLRRVSVGRFYRNCKGAVIYEGTREIHKIMQADYLLGYRTDKPTRCELPAWRQDGN